MKNDLITRAYEDYRNKVFLYFLNRIEHEEDAQDLTQDVFLRLMESPEFLQEDTLRSLVFTIAHNLMMDYLRRHYAWQKAAAHLRSSAAWITNDTDQHTVTEDLKQKENVCISQMPELRRKVYRMVRYDGKTATEVAGALKKPVKIITDQLYLGRKTVRTYMKACI